MRRVSEINQELWVVLSMFVLAAALNFVLDAQRMVLGLYTLPVLYSAYVYGRRHAVLTAFGSAFLVGIVAWYDPHPFPHNAIRLPLDDRRGRERLGRLEGAVVLLLGHLRELPD